MDLYLQVHHQGHGPISTGPSSGTWTSIYRSIIRDMDLYLQVHHQGHGPLSTGPSSGTRSQLLNSASTWVARDEFIVAHPDGCTGTGVEGVRVEAGAALFVEDVDVVQQLFTRTGGVLAAHRQPND